MKLPNAKTPVWRFRPVRWADYLGRAKPLFQAIVQSDGDCGVTLVLGQNGSGKSSGVNLLSLSLFCQARPEGTCCDPCLTCFNCRQLLLNPDSWVGRMIRDQWVVLEYCDCSQYAADPQKLARVLADLRGSGDRTFVILEEFETVARLALVTSLKGPLEAADATWLIVNPVESAVDHAIRRRIRHRITAGVDDPAELERWARRRCAEAGIPVDDPATLRCLAERAGCDANKALIVISEALAREGRLTRSFVSSYHYYDSVDEIDDEES
jgi:hypothetical protein